MTAKKRVLILDGGDGSSALTVARSLGLAGYEAHLGFAVGTPSRSAVSKYCAGMTTYPDPAYARDAFQSFLLHLAPSYGAIVPIKEVSLLATSAIRTELEARGATVPICDAETLSTATRKLEMLRLAGEAGIRTPRTLVLEELGSPTSVAERLGRPFVMKSSTEIGMLPVDRHYIVTDPTADWVPERFAALARHGPVIVQEYIAGASIGVALLYARSGALIGYSGHERLFEEFSDGGPSVLARTFVHEGALAGARVLLERLRWKGVAMAEFKVDSTGEPVYMEVNPRFWGTLSLAIASGVDFPELLLRYFDTPAPPPPVAPRRRRTFLSLEALTISLTAPAEKRPKLERFASQLGRHPRGLAIRELQGADPRPDLEELVHFLRARSVRLRVSRLGELRFGPARDYRALARRGVRTVLDLREPKEVRAKPLETPIGMTRIAYPLRDDAGAEIAQFREIVSILDTARASGPVFVHCRLGKGRAPMVVAALLVAHGAPLVDALRSVDAARPYASLTGDQRAALYAFSLSIAAGTPPPVAGS